MCRVALVLLKEGVCCDQSVLLAKLCEPLPCFILYSKAKLACFQVSWLPTFVFQSPMMKRTSFFLVLVLEGLEGHHRTVQPSFFGLGGWGIDFDYCDFEWVAFEMNRDHSVVFEIAPKYCILDSCWLWGVLYCIEVCDPFSATFCIMWNLGWGSIFL